MGCGSNRGKMRGAKNADVLSVDIETNGEILAKKRVLSKVDTK